MADPKEKAATDGLVTVTVAPGHTVTLSESERFETKDPAKPIINSTLRSHGPGKTLRVSKDEAKALLKAGVIVDPNAKAPVAPKAPGPTVTVAGQEARARPAG